MSAVFAREVPELSISFGFIPQSIYPGQYTIGNFNISNPHGARPVFDLNITLWVPCGNDEYTDFLEVTDWTVDNPSWKNTRIVFSGILDNREITSEVSPYQTYVQCLYSFVFQLPSQAEKFKGPAVIRPGENISLNFTLQSTISARPGLYDVNIISQDYIKPGKELAALIKE